MLLLKLKGGQNRNHKHFSSHVVKFLNISTDIKQDYAFKLSYQNMNLILSQIQKIMSCASNREKTSHVTLQAYYGHGYS